MWFIAGPAFILSANSYIDKWIRESVVCSVLQFISFGGHLTFLVRPLNFYLSKLQIPALPTFCYTYKRQIYE